MKCLMCIFRLNLINAAYQARFSLHSPGTFCESKPLTEDKILTAAFDVFHTLIKSPLKYKTVEIN